ncbi:uncharacterized protein ARMOST_17021 [Armillaria ostoyae]|uniref:Uncharacterized protein n=1 Tax=Armillaria ostoyae TaxID=47428 RepID=A0A284RXU5_ARMOS|nr:uncharacterized protein ARMOST_17021 [Armillaria ostoyae]
MSVETEGRYIIWSLAGDVQIVAQDREVSIRIKLCHEVFALFSNSVTSAVFGLQASAPDSGATKLSSRSQISANPKSCQHLLVHPATGESYLSGFVALALLLGHLLFMAQDWASVRILAVLVQITEPPTQLNLLPPMFPGGPGGTARRSRGVQKR